MGIISDIIFNPKDGQIEGYEISKGVIDDLLTGRNILSGGFSPFSEGNVTVISMDGNIELKSNNKGILKIFTDTED